MSKARPASSPIVIFGGFLSVAIVYNEMQAALSRLLGGRVAVVPTLGVDWLLCVAPPGWALMLQKLDLVVRAQAEKSLTGKVTLIGHSAGGVLGRMYLSPRTFLGRSYAGLRHVDHLVTLGSPHYNQGRIIYGGLLSRWVEQRYPANYYSPQVRYTSVAGRYAPGALRGSWRNFWRYNIYADIGGDGAAWGDGVVPVQSALLKGSHQVVLEKVSHYSVLGEPWYGSEAVVLRWWQAALSELKHRSQERYQEGPERSV